ncbi:MAG: hypothetical protein WBZ36_05070, partial [Candidatus Nitrosopolaris sp.]
MSIRNYITKDKLERIAIDKYRENGLGITIGDIGREFSVNKAKAQRTLKYFHEGKILFTANDLIIEGISILQNKSPQQYLPTCIKAEIIEDLSKRKNVPVNPTGVNQSSSPPSALTSNSGDQIVLQTLEGHI